ALLDGVYRSSDIYMRILERFSALNFGTHLGRQLTRFISLPAAGGFFIAALVLIVFARTAHPAQAKFPYAPWAVFHTVWAGCALTCFALLHFTNLRHQLAVLGKTLG